MTRPRHSYQQFEHKALAIYGARADLRPGGCGFQQKLATTTVTTGFRHLAEAEANDIRQLFRYGRRALLIGLGVLSACLLLAMRTSAKLGEGEFSTIVHESSVIFGAVAIWRPAEIFLYDWLPKVRRLALLRRLSAALVTLQSEPGPT